MIFVYFLITYLNKGVPYPALRNPRERPSRVKGPKLECDKIRLGNYKYCILPDNAKLEIDQIFKNYYVSIRSTVSDIDLI